MTSAIDWRTRVGSVWAEEWRRTDRAFAGLTPHLDAAIRAAAPQGPFAALDIGCGAGETAAALAAAVPRAQVTGVDLSADLVAVARARHAGLANLAFRHADALDAAGDLAPLDLVVSRHGVMFFADPAAAFARLRRAVADDATMVFSCFRDRADNPWAGDLVAQVTGAAPSGADGYAPGPFGFADPAIPAAVLAQAGWTSEAPTRIDFAYVVGAGDDPVADAAAFFRRIGPLAAALAGAGDRAAREGKLKTILARYLYDGVVAFPASAWLWRAHATGERS